MSDVWNSSLLFLICVLNNGQNIDDDTVMLTFDPLDYWTEMISTFSSQLCAVPTDQQHKAEKFFKINRMPCPRDEINQMLHSGLMRLFFSLRQTTLEMLSIGAQR